MISNVKKIYTAVLIVMLASIVTVSCGIFKSTDAVISFYSGTATIQSVNSQPRQVVVKDIVKDGDIIETGDKSSVAVQVGDELLVRFEANTKVVVTSITAIAKREINLADGKVLSSVKKLKKGNEYFVKTPTAVASVRGTEFLTDFKEGRTVVAVGKGSVNVVKNITKEEKLADPGKTVVVAESVETREINEIETLELKKLETTPVVNDIDNAKNEDLKKTFENTVISDKEINDRIEELSRIKLMTLEELRAKYKRLDVITMYNGRVVKGVIMSRGSVLKILTPHGIETVKVKDVQRTKVI